MRIQGIVLEDHGNVAVLGGNIVHQLVTDIKLAAADEFEPGDHTQSCGFAAAGRSDQNNKLLICNFQIEFLNSHNTFISDLKVCLLFRRVVLFPFPFFLFAGNEWIDFFDVF